VLTTATSSTPDTHRVTFSRLTLPHHWLATVGAWVFVLGYNQPLWQRISPTVPDTFQGTLFLAAFALFLATVLTVLLQSIAIPKLQKPMLIFLFMSAAPIHFFMTHYGVIIDKSMVQNAFETDTAEVHDLLSGAFILHLLLFGVLPSALVCWVRITYPTLKKGLLIWLVYLIAAIITIVALNAGFSKSFSSTFRNHREIRHLIIPSNYLYYTGRYLSGAYDVQNQPLQRIGEDAKLAPIWDRIQKPIVTVVIVGETARAANFGLNGYERNTTPELSQLPIINFGSVESCGTSTAVSVPCMFSDMTHANYDGSTATHRENVLDVLGHAGIPVLWRDNNSGCKGVCDRITSQPQSTYWDDSVCKDDHCFDEAMTHHLDTWLANAGDKAVIVLHQQGSHGPAYYQRYPKAFEQFTPICETGDLKTCSPEAIRNTYDNSLLYTDHVIANVIRYFQERNDQWASSVVYLSDHGESLGENNMYLHGMPYFIAPDTQTHVPMVAWLSDAFQQQMEIDTNCVQQQAKTATSQDALFHSLLGLMAVDTHLYQKDQDRFGVCRRG
jgi:lipid A ethanolaminephosphotransferase